MEALANMDERKSRIVELRFFGGLTVEEAADCEVTLDEGRVGAKEPPADVVALDDALTALAVIDERKSQVVEMHYFGLSIEATAEALGVSMRTVKRDWTMAKLWLVRELKKSHD